MHPCEVFRENDEPCHGGVSLPRVLQHQQLDVKYKTKTFFVGSLSQPCPCSSHRQVLHAFYKLVPTVTAEGVFKAELLEDFILTMALRSTHLALKLVW